MQITHSLTTGHYSAARYHQHQRASAALTTLVNRLYHNHIAWQLPQRGTTVVRSSGRVDVDELLREYRKREEYLQIELSAVRVQVDRLLQQQAVLLHMLGAQPVQHNQAQSVHSPGGHRLAAPPALHDMTPASAASPPIPPLPTPQVAVLTAPPPMLATSSAPSLPGTAHTTQQCTPTPAPAPHPLPPPPVAGAPLYIPGLMRPPSAADTSAAACVMAALRAVDYADVLGSTFEAHLRTVSQRQAQPRPAQPTAPASQAAAPQAPSLPAAELPLAGATAVGVQAGAAAPTGPAAAAADSATASASDLAQMALPASAHESVAAVGACGSAEAAEGAEAACPAPDPGGPPPVLTMGSDDIYWMNKLHTALDSDGFFPGYADMEDWFFGESTLEALLAFQASKQLPETGVVDEATWIALGVTPHEHVGPHPPHAPPDSQVPQLVAVHPAEASDASLSTTSTTSTTTSTITYTAAQLSQEQGTPGNRRSVIPGATPTAAATSVEAAAFMVSTSVAVEVEMTSAVTAATSSPHPSTRDTSEAIKHLTKWPVLMEMDGGREVHALQVALMNKGYYCGEDDMQWWMFGSSTQMALRTFQGCQGLPESGVADARTWQTLLGPAAQPNDLWQVRAEDADSEQYSEDLSQSGRVWLMGEGRWERRA